MHNGLAVDYVIVKRCRANNSKRTNARSLLFSMQLSLHLFNGNDKSLLKLKQRGSWRSGSSAWWPRALSRQVALPPVDLLLESVEENGPAWFHQLPFSSFSELVSACVLRTNSNAYQRIGVTCTNMALDSKYCKRLSARLPCGEGCSHWWVGIYYCNLVDLLLKQDSTRFKWDLDASSVRVLPAVTKRSCTYCVNCSGESIWMAHLCPICWLI